MTKHTIWPTSKQTTCLTS